MVDFYIFCTSGKRKEYTEVNKTYYFSLTVSPHYLVKLKQHLNSTFWNNHHSAFDRTSCSQLRQNVVQCSSFPKILYHSSVRKIFTFPQVFDKKIRSIFKLNVFNFKSNYSVGLWSKLLCHAMWCNYDVIKPLNKEIVEYFFPFLLV